MISPRLAQISGDLFGRRGTNLPSKNHGSSFGFAEFGGGDGGFQLDVPAPEVIETGRVDDVECAFHLLEVRVIATKEVAGEELRLQRCFVEEVIVTAVHEVLGQIRAEDSGCRSAIVNNLANILTEAASQVQKAVAIFDPVQK